ncbi:MAG: hypothetical protein R3Y12_01080 [Clostridia bacterium]
MNYKKMREILLVLLAFTNVILLFNYSVTKLEDDKIYQQMIENNIIYLNNKGVFVDQQILETEIPTNIGYVYSTISKVNIENVLEGISSSENNLFIADNGTAKIDTDGSFAINLIEEHTKESVENILLQANFDLSTAHVEEKSNLIRYTLKINENIVSNCFFEVILNNSTTTIAGNYVFEQPQQIRVQNAFSIFSAIVELSDFYKITGQVNSVSLDYMLFSETNMQILPVFKAEIDGKEYFYNIFESVTSSI